MKRERIEELCAAYVLNALDGRDLKVFNTLLAKDDPVVKRVLQQMQWVALHLPLSANPATPPPEARTRILSAVRKIDSVKTLGLVDRLISMLGLEQPRVVLTVSLALAAMVAGLIYYSITLTGTIGSQNQQLIVLRDELTRKQELLSILQARRIDVVIMNGLEVNPAAYGKIIWDPDRKRAILQISNLPPVPSDKDYQLWTIHNNVPVSAGVFAVTDEDEKEQFFKILELQIVEKKEIDAFAVTLEPKGGVRQPTGPMYLLGPTSL